MRLQASVLPVRRGLKEASLTQQLPTLPTDLVLSNTVLSALRRQLHPFRPELIRVDDTQQDTHVWKTSSLVTFFARTAG